MEVYVLIQERPDCQYRPDRPTDVVGVFACREVAERRLTALVAEAVECGQVVRYAGNKDSDAPYDVEIFIEARRLTDEGDEQAMQSVLNTVAAIEQGEGIVFRDNNLGDDCAFLREALNAILAVPVTSNSWDPDDMGKALDYIETVAMAALAGQPLPEPMSEPAQDDEANRGEGDRE